MTYWLLIVGGALGAIAAGAAVGFCAGWRARAARADREDAQSGYVVCGVLFSLRDLLDAGKLPELHNAITMQARVYHRLWSLLGGRMPTRDGALTLAFHQAHEEFVAEPEDDDDDIAGA